MSATSIYIKCDLCPTPENAWRQWVVDRLETLDPGTSYETPLSTVTLPDTTSEIGNWKRKRNYYGQSLGGTDWPDRFLVSSIPQST